MRILKKILEKKVKTGQTVIEIIIALAVLSLFMSGVVVVELYAVRNLEYSQNKSTATRLARQQLERARVLRDSGGIFDLGTYCAQTPYGGCYIDSNLGPTPYQQITPASVFWQKLVVSSASDSDCPLPTVIVPPVPTIYLLKANVSWGQNLEITPAPQVEMSSCLSDWR